MEAFAKLLIGIAAMLFVVGAVLLLASKLGVGRLPGDVLIRRRNFTFYAPLGLMLALSLIGTILLNLLMRR